MANLGTTLNANDYEAPSFEPIPKGEYPMWIIESDVESNSKNTGRNLKFVLEITQGQYKGRKIYESLSFENPSEIAVKIARGMISAICHAVGQVELSDSTTLHNKEFLGKVKVKKGNDGYDDSNSLAGAKALTGGNPAQGAGNGGFNGFNNGQSQGQQQNTGFNGFDNGGQQNNQGSYGQYGNQNQGFANGNGAGNQGFNGNGNQQQTNGNGFQNSGGFDQTNIQNQNQGQGFNQGGNQNQNGGAGFQNGGFQNSNGNQPQDQGFNQNNGNGQQSNQQQQVDTSPVAEMNFNGQNQQQGNGFNQNQNQGQNQQQTNSDDVPPWQRNQ